MTPEEYEKLVTNIYNLIQKEINQAKDKDLALLYPKLVTMYEFFRLLRGEAFTEYRPHTPNNQKDFYRMEDEIGKELNEIKNKINFEDERVKFYIEEAQKYYLKKE